jgi:hypothetical protein
MLKGVSGHSIILAFKPVYIIPDFCTWLLESWKCSLFFLYPARIYVDNSSLISRFPACPAPGLSFICLHSNPSFTATVTATVIDRQSTA